MSRLCSVHFSSNMLRMSDLFINRKFIAATAEFAEVSYICFASLNQNTGDDHHRIDIVQYGLSHRQVQTSMRAPTDPLLFHKVFN